MDSEEFRKTIAGRLRLPVDRLHFLAWRFADKDGRVGFEECDFEECDAVNFPRWSRDQFDHGIEFLEGARYGHAWNPGTKEFDLDDANAISLYLVKKHGFVGGKRPSRSGDSWTFWRNKPYFPTQPNEIVRYEPVRNKHRFVPRQKRQRP